MTRALFPYDEDRFVIDEFLRGRDASSDWMSSKAANGGRVLCFGETPMAVVDAQGALQVMPPSAHGWSPVVRRALNAMLEALQLDERIGRNTEDGFDPATTFDGVELAPGVPLTILGPLGLRAWREAHP